MADIAILIEGLEKSYGSFKALHGVDLEVRQGEILGFLGPNGAGKTTTIRCILDQIRPQKGSIHVFGINPQSQPTKVHQMTGYLPGEYDSGRITGSELRGDRIIEYQSGSGEDR